MGIFLVVVKGICLGCPIVVENGFSSGAILTMVRELLQHLQMIKS